MSKRKIIIQGNTEYLIEQQGVYSGRIQVVEEFQVEFEAKTKGNIGGEAWDWAQSHWDSFIPEEGPNVVFWPQGSVLPFEVDTVLRWFCVTGVTDLKGKQLPIEAPKYTKKAPAKTTSKKYKKTTSKKGTSLREVHSPKQEVKPGDNLIAGYTSAEEYRAAAIRKVFEEDEDGTVQ